MLYTANLQNAINEDAKWIGKMKEDYAHPREGEYEWTYDKFVSEILPEIKELLGVNKI